MPQTADTPLMQQWREVKSRHADALLFFRVGDFYEFFYGDAEEGSRLLGLTLTSRNNGSASAVPLAGVPAKALPEYVERLVRMGRRVAICEQVEDPAEAKGIVRREVVETVTPGTAMHDRFLEAGKNNYLVAVTGPAAGERGLAALDLSTGELSVEAVAEEHLEDALGRLAPTELLLPASLENDAAAGSAQPARTYRADWMFDVQTAREALTKTLEVHSLEGLGFLDGDELLVSAAGALVSYVSEIQPAGVEHVRPPRIRRPGSVMLLDDMTRRNLELTETLRPDAAGGTLLEVIDRTRTAMGARLLRAWLLNPLLDAEAIWSRQRGVSGFYQDPETRARVRDVLGGVTDLERMAGKLGSARAGPRELLSLRRSLEALPALVQALGGGTDEAVRALAEGVDPLADVRDLLAAAVAEDPPHALQDGGVIAPGYSDELDELRAARDSAVEFIASLQARERDRTGIASLKVGYNKVFGYYLEVTRANLDRVPEDYVRKQTLANAERYFTPELKTWEEKVTGADDRIAALEAELFGELRRSLAREVPRLQALADRMARVDVLAALAELARSGRYARPEVHTGYDLEIVSGRHPVVETMMGAEDFIPNDLRMSGERRIVILTGPNMAGKSTVLRQVGLIQLMAQMGSYVPADRARLPVVDRIFTRVGASDNLVRGQSTFMVEMTETAAILNGATDRSLVLLDEIGRGTSTYDGVSIAWSVTEHLHEHTGAKTIFATHYHELTQLGDLMPAVTNLNVSVREVGDRVVFLRRLEEGGADRSYGIQVARLAGLPPEVLERAREILTELEGTHTGGGAGLGREGAHRPASLPGTDQLFLGFGDHPALSELRELDPDAMTPLEALNRLAELKRRVEGS